MADDAATVEQLQAELRALRAEKTVLRAIVEAAARLCDAPSGLLQQVRARDGRLSHRAGVGPLEESAVWRFGADAFERVRGAEVSRASVGGRAFVERRTIHVHDSVIAIENARLFGALREANRQLEEASRHKSQFLANMSHELRTPLNAIFDVRRLVDDVVAVARPGLHLHRGPPR